MGGRESKESKETATPKTVNNVSPSPSGYQPSSFHVQPTENKNDCAVRTQVGLSSASSEKYSKTYSTWLNDTAQSHATVTQPTLNHSVTAKSDNWNTETMTGHQSRNRESRQVTQVERYSNAPQRLRDLTEHAPSGNRMISQVQKPVTPATSRNNVTQQYRDMPGRTTYDHYNKPTVTPATSSSNATQQYRDMPWRTTYDHHNKPTVTPAVSSSNVTQQYRDMPGRTTYDHYNKPTVTPATSSSNVTQQHRVMPGKSTYDHHNKPTVTPAVSSSNVTQQYRDMPGRTSYDHHNKPTVTPATSRSFVMQQYRYMPGRTTYDHYNKPRVTPAVSSSNVTQQQQYRDMPRRTTYDHVTQQTSNVTYRQPESKVLARDSYFEFDPLNGIVTHAPVDDHVTDVHCETKTVTDSQQRSYSNNMRSSERVLDSESMSMSENATQKRPNKDAIRVVPERCVAMQEVFYNHDICGSTNSLEMGYDILEDCDKSSQSENSYDVDGGNAVDKDNDGTLDRDADGGEGFDGDGDKDHIDDCYNTKKQQEDSEYKPNDNTDDYGGTGRTSYRNYLDEDEGDDSGSDVDSVDDDDEINDDDDKYGGSGSTRDGNGNIENGAGKNGDCVDGDDDDDVIVDNDGDDDDVDDVAVDDDDDDDGVIVDNDDGDDDDDVIVDNDGDDDDDDDDDGVIVDNDDGDDDYDDDVGGSEEYDGIKKNDGCIQLSAASLQALEDKAIVDSEALDSSINENSLNSSPDDNNIDELQEMAQNNSRSPEVLLQITFPNAVNIKTAENELKKAAKKSKFKLVGEQNGNVRKKIYCVSFPNRRKAKSAMHFLQRKKIKTVLCRTLLENCQEKIKGEKEIALSVHNEKCEVVTQKMMTFQKESTKKKKITFRPFEEFEKLEALKQTAKELNGQTKEFVDLINVLLQELESLKDVCDRNICEDISNIEQRFQREKDRLSNGLPIYAEKSRIIRTIQGNQVCIILGETGSGKSTQIVQYLYDAGFAENNTIVCTQPRKVAAFSLGRRVCEELKNPKLVDCIELSRHRKSSILFTTDHALLMKCLRDRDLSHYSCVVIDEAHERNINTDLLLGIIKKALPKRPELRVVVTSATIDPTLFQQYFGSCPVIKVSGKLFPVEIEWKKCPSGDTFTSGDYVAEAVDKVVDICRSNEAGDVLVFLTCPAEIEQACKTLSSTINTRDIICLPLHGKLQQEDQQKVFEPTPSGKRKVVFSTNCAETSLTIPGIKFVIDSGRVKEMKYDQKRNMSSLEISLVSQSSANQRKGRAGRTDTGKCFRLYTEEEYNAMEKSSKPEILRVHLGQALLKLMELGIDNPADFDYVESPKIESIKAAMAELEELEATSEGKLTDLGKNMARVPLDPRLGKFLFEGLNHQVGYEALVLVSISTLAGSVFFRMGSEEEKKKADDKKVEFCQLGGDLMTLLHVFRNWLEVNERERGKWCYEKSLNAKSMRIANETVKDLKMVLKRDLKIDGICWAPFDRDTTDGIIQRTLFRCFLTNLCVFTGHEKVGYQTVNDGRYYKIHPSSAVKVMGEYPRFVVYEKVLKTTQNFILNVTPIEECWLMDTITEPRLLASIQLILDETLIKQTIKCSESLIKETLFPPKSKIPEVEFYISQACAGKPVIVEMNKKHGLVDIFVSRKCATKGEQAMQDLLEAGRKRLQEQANEFEVEGAPLLQVVIQSGLTIQHILMPGMFRTVFSPRYDPELIEFLQSQGDVIEVSSNKQQQLFVTYKSPDEAKIAVNLAKQLQLDVQPRSYKNQQQVRQNFNFVLDIKWLRRKAKGTARVVYSNPVPWYDLPLRWSLDVMVKSNNVRVTADKFDMDAVFLRGLDSTATKQEIKEALDSIFPVEDVKDKDILIHYQQRETNQLVSPADQKRSLEELMKQCTSSCSFEVFINPIPPQLIDKAVYGYAKVWFSSPNQGMMVAKQLQNRSCIGLEQWTVHLEVHPKLDFYYTCLKSVYDLVKPDVDKRIHEIAYDCRFQCNKVLVLQVEPLGKSSKSNRVKLLIQSECIDHYVEAATVLSTSIQGEVFDCTNPQSRLPLLKPTSKNKLATIQKTTDTLIYPDSRTKALVIYGAPARKKEAVVVLERSVGEIVPDNSVIWEVCLKGPNKPRGLLKQMMANFGCDFETLREVEGVMNVTKCLFKHVLTIHSSKQAKEHVMRRLEEVERSLPQQQPPQETNDDSTREDCPICFCEVDEDDQAYRLSTCGHMHCKECITAQLKSAAAFPLVCAAENCGEQIVVKDLQNVLQPGKELNDFVQIALRSYVDEDQERAKYCPSPDCPMVYLVTEDAQPFQCNVCCATTCTSCHKPYHLGMTCKEYEIDLKDPGAQALRKWMMEDSDNRKYCPNCKSPIEKNDGCNHMKCKRCKAHFCWKCLKVYPTGKMVYDHQRDCPGQPAD